MNASDPRQHAERVVRLLAELVSIPSVNVNRAESDACNPEAAMVDFLAERLTVIGCRVERRPVRAGRENILALLPGADHSKTLVLEAHTDTVGVRGMTVEPFRPRLVEGRMTGRGTCDTKGSLAAFVEAMQRVAESGRRPPWDVLFVGCMGEETGCEGAMALANEGFRADAALVGEATCCRPMITHKGAIWWQLSTEGVTAHGSSPHLGVNAVYRMRRVLRVLEEEVPGRLAAARDPMLGSPTISCGMISGGEKPNVVPGNATITLDSRVLPGVDAKTHIHGVMTWIRESTGERIGAMGVHMLEDFPGFRIDPEHPLVNLCSSVCRQVLRDEVRPVGGSFFSDAGPLARGGTPCVVFGPGDVGKAHSPDEHLAVDQLLQCAQIVEKLICEIGSLEPP